MAAPSNPTLDTLVREGLAKAGENSPSAALLARAQTEFISEIKNDLFKDIKQPKFLQVTSHGILVRGQSRYSMPNDYSNDLTLTLLEGTITGIAQGASSATIQLAVSDITEDQVIGKQLLITAGPGKAAVSQIISYDPTTQTASVSPVFPASPGPGSEYMIIHSETPLDGDAVWNADNGKFVSLAKPKKFITTGDDSAGEFELDSPPDKVYGLRLRYYVNILKLDPGSPMMSNLYSRWENMWKKGICAKHLADNDDDRATAKDGEYRAEAQSILASEGYGVDIHNLKERVTDYY